jgi:hypothetical protein
MANNNADIRILVGSEVAQSTNIIRKELESAFSKNALQISAKLSDSALKEIQKQLSSLKVDGFDVGAGAVKAKNSGQQKGAAAAQAELNINKQLEKSLERAANIKKKTQRIDDIKQAAAFNKHLEQEYQLRLKNKNIQEQISKSYWDGRFKESIKDSTSTNSELLKMRSYYSEIEKSSAAAAKEQTKLSNATAKMHANAASQKASFQQYLQTLNPAVLKQYDSEIQDIFNNFSIAANSAGDNSRKALEDAANGMKNFKGQMKELGVEGANIFTYLHSKLKTFSVYLISSFLAIGAVSGVRNAINVIYDLNEALVDLRIVTGDSKANAKELLATYNNMAQALGSTTKAVADSAVEWQRQGYNLEDTNTLIQDSMILSIVGMVDSAEASKYLTASIKGYKTEVSDAIGIVDKLTAIDIKAAVSAGGLAEAMARTANSARLAGVDMNTLLGYLAAVGEVTQREMTTVGEAFKTIFARYSNVKLGRLIDDESGESLKFWGIAA